MAKNVKIDSNKYVRFCNELSAQLENYYQALKGISTSATILMKGESNNPYYNGSVALNMYNEIKKTISDGVAVYTSIALEWEYYIGLYEHLLRAGYFTDTNDPNMRAKAVANTTQYIKDNWSY